MRPCAVVEAGADETSEMTLVLTFGDGWSDFGVAACESAPHRIGCFGSNDTEKEKARWKGTRRSGKRPTARSSFDIFGVFPAWGFGVGARPTVAGL